LKNVRELLYKHGHGSVDGRRMPLTSNADIEKVLGMCAVVTFTAVYCGLVLRYSHYICHGYSVVSCNFTVLQPSIFFPQTSIEHINKN